MLPLLAIKPISEERMFRFPEQGKQGREKHRADCDLVRRPGHSPRAALAAWQQGLSLANKGSEAKTLQSQHHHFSNASATSSKITASICWAGEAGSQSLNCRS
jgi:hypothetical protein